jgi:hypothetical protein
VPSPIGHALGGVIVALALAPRSNFRWSGDRDNRVEHEDHEEHEVQYPKREERKNPLKKLDLRAVRDLRALRHFAGWCAVVACLPDVDFAWGRHNMETHSIGFAAIVGLVVYAWRRDARLAVACALATVTHVAFDALGTDDVAPLGVMAWWPFSTTFFYAEAEVFAAIGRRWPDLLRQNTLAILRELAILLPVLLAILALRWPANGRRAGGGRSRWS